MPGANTKEQQNKHTVLLGPWYHAGSGDLDAAIKRRGLPGQESIEQVDCMLTAALERYTCLQDCVRRVVLQPDQQYYR